jgi:dolichyl-phosphate beta-glucosyltransferase
MGQDLNNTMTQPYRCTLIIPTFNASDIIEGVVSRLRRFLADHADWCVLFVLDGCTDNTTEKLKHLLVEGDPSMRAEIYAVNRGKGYALHRGLSRAETPYRIYTDVDLAYDPDEAIKLLEMLEAGADLAVVNRAHPDSCFEVSPRDFPRIYKRHLMSRTFNWWLRQTLPIKILDTQAGLKGITGAAWAALSEQVRSDGFFFDVELLALASASGMTIAESPIRFRYVDPSTVKLVSHGWSMILDSLRLRRAMRRARLARQDQPALNLAPRGQ